MTEQQLKKGYWHVDKESKLPNQVISLVDDYLPAERLRLLITQTHLSPYQQKKNYEHWCEILPSLSEVKTLYLPSKVNQKIFDAVCQMPNLEGLHIKWSGIKKLDSLVNLKKLKHFYLGSSSQVQSIEVFTELSNLESLETENLKLISDFSAIAKLQQLQGLGINGSMWTAQKIDSLEPIRNLKELKYLSLRNSQIKDKSFDPILGLQQLVRFDSSWNYPESEFDKLKTMANLRYGNIQTSGKEIWS
ncbi:leucine-rich repeat domain-containing protein [Croceimicrobium hydrocarbonivorans]|uniref:Leucine-rich repeat domain-containing protein n=1 Tax=Croceimicrobium hydrocarbonivorans TaxID=2761580 RepID=A0A7H0VHH0_9FLAO|nr:hypothetical protein [Croceimicrobium hydrocarbonivorans]QNR25168.1 hypothetical protein H4K34_04835 [Croceimicrobium hydrocarbonivorans]